MAGGVVVGDEPFDPSGVPGKAEGSSSYSVTRMNRVYGFVLIGGKPAILREQPGAPAEHRFTVLSIDGFKGRFHNQYVERRDPISGKMKTSRVGDVFMADTKRRSYDGIEFYPDPKAAVGTKGYYNLWRGFAVKAKAKPDGYAVFRDHLLTNVCGGKQDLYDWVFGWFAHIVQRPRERPETALVLRGRMGTGKSLVGEVFGGLLGPHHVVVDDPRYVTGQFNSHMASCLLLQAEEAVWAGDKIAEGRLKGLITSKTQMVEYKGVDAIKLPNLVRLLLTSNEGWVAPAGKDERRWCVLDIDPRCAQNHDYFREMLFELDSGGREALLHDMLAFDLSKVDVRIIPRTAALLEQKIRTFDPIDNWWFQRLRSGGITSKHDDWLELIPVEALYEDFVATAEKIGVRRKSDLTSFGIHLRKIVPGINRVKRTGVADAIDGLPGMRRVHCYQLPSLDDCRDLFEEAMGQTIDWDTP